MPHSECSFKKGVELFPYKQDNASHKELPSRFANYSHHLHPHFFFKFVEIFFSALLILILKNKGMYC